jgi:hypothetical protein
MLKYIFNLSFLLMLALTSYGQDKQLDPTDTVKNKYLPSGIRIGTDVISIIKSQSGNKFEGWEINADIDFYRYYLVVDYGSWARSEELVNGSYQNDGNYFRIGTDVNFMLKDPDRNMFFLGFRYGQSKFDEVLNYTFTDPAFGNFQKSVTTSQIIGRWAELTAGLRVKIWKGFWMGYTARLKFAPGTSSTPGVIPYDIPGYGRAEKSTYWGLNYQVFWRIPFRKLD